MVLHIAAAAVKVNLSIALRGTVVSPTCLLLCYLVKVTLGTGWFHDTFDDTAHGFRVFLFQLSRIVFGPAGDDDGGRWERAVRLLRQCVGTRPAAEEVVNYHLLSMTSL